jgi:Asp-tRNA(Asn)/Glu-tRNA(Gln) amidotransferase A subunit family amidase
MARTVTDLVQLLDVIAGVDPMDPATAEADGRIPPTYTAFLKPDGARGRRIGVLRQALRPDASDPQILGLFDRAVADLRRAGAEVVDPFVIPAFDQFAPRLHPLSEVRAALERYLAKTGPRFPKSLAEVVASGKFHPLHEVGLLEASTAPAPEADPVVKQLEADEARMRTAYLAAMDELRIDALAFPTATYPPKLNGDRNTTPAGALSGIGSALRWPAVVVPMGYSYESLPSGLQLLGRPWSEPILIELAYVYEQATRHRVPPTTVPPLRD